jgi:cyclase
MNFQKYMRKNLIILFTILSAAIPIFGHGGFSDDEHNTKDVTVKTIKITDKIYMLQGSGGNIGLSLGDSGILMIDDDYAAVSEKLAEALGKLGPMNPKFVFNTHWHADHTEGNKYFGKNSMIVSHINVKKRLSEDTMIFGNKSLAFEPYAQPMLTFEQSMSVHFNGEEVKAVYYANAHTDGDSVIYFPKSNVVHMGDLYFQNRFPFVDLENGGSVEGLAKHLGDIIAKLPADIKIIPGHGALSNLEELKLYHKMIEDTTAILKKGMKKKKSLEELKKAGLPEKYLDWGRGFIKQDFWIETIYKSLNNKK